MSRCLGCFESIDGVTGPCPYCGYSKDAPAQNKIFLSHGTMLAERYKIGNITRHDNENTTYIAWDNVLECKVNITEYLPVQHVARNPENNELTATSDSSSAVFDKGFIQFVNKAKQLYKEGGSVMVYDCIAENNTAYMILEYKPEKKPYVGVFKPQFEQPELKKPVAEPPKPLQPQSEKRKPAPPGSLQPQSEKRKPVPPKTVQPAQQPKPLVTTEPEAAETTEVTKVKPPRPQAQRISTSSEPEKLDPTLQSPAYQIYQMQPKVQEPVPAPVPLSPENSPFKHPAPAQTQQAPSVPVQTMPPSPRPEPAVPIQRPVVNNTAAPVNSPQAPRTVSSAPRAASPAPARQSNSSEGPLQKIALLPMWLKVAVPAVLVVGVVLIILAASGVFKKPAKKPDVTEPSETTAETEPEIIEVTLDEKTSFSFRGHSYAYYTEADSWEAAEEYCEARGGHLVVITTKEENDAVWAFAQNLDNKSLFIGLSDASSEGKWQWVTGEPVSFTNWVDGEPSASTEDENYAELSFNNDYRGGYWNDFSFDKHGNVESTGFICEWDYDMVNPVADTALTSDEALTAFRYHVAESLIAYENHKRGQAETEVQENDEDDGEEEDYIEDNAFEPVIANWKQLENNNGICSFFYQMENGECFVYYTDLSTGITTSLRYADPSLDIALSIGQSDYNAFECLEAIKELPDNSSATELKDYLNKDIRESATAIGNLEDVSPEGNIELSSEDMYITTSRDSGTENISYIQLRGSSGKYCLYGATSRVYWNDVVKAIVLNGAQTATRVDDRTYVLTMEDGTTVTITNTESRLVTHIAAKVE